MTDVDRLSVVVLGRPAPQGSKRHGAYGQMREQSAYLPAWRSAIKLAVYTEYHRLGVAAESLPLLRGPIAARLWFALDHGARIDGPPDLDKLLRSTWDALTAAHVWEDDARVVYVETGKSEATEIPAGVVIEVWRTATNGERR